jgi:hypothetical protein
VLKKGSSDEDRVVVGVGFEIRRESSAKEETVDT